MKQLWGWCWSVGLTKTVEKWIFWKSKLFLVEVMFKHLKPRRSMSAFTKTTITNISNLMWIMLLFVSMPKTSPQQRRPGVTRTSMCMHPKCSCLQSIELISRSVHYLGKTSLIRSHHGKELINTSIKSPSMRILELIGESWVQVWELHW